MIVVCSDPRMRWVRVPGQSGRGGSGRIILLIDLVDLILQLTPGWRVVGKKISLLLGMGTDCMLQRRFVLDGVGWKGRMFGFLQYCESLVLLLDRLLCQDGLLLSMLNLEFLLTVVLVLPVRRYWRQRSSVLRSMETPCYAGGI